MRSTRRDAAHLNDALAHIASGRPAAALSALLKAWRQTHDPRLASAIEGLSDRIKGPVRPDALHDADLTSKQAWLSLAKGRDDSTIPWLLAELEHRRDDITEERLAAMAKWPADPRIAAHACKVLVTLEGRNARRNGPRLLDLIASTGDPRSIAALGPVRELRAELGREVARRARETADALAHVAVRDVPANLLAAVEAAVAAASSAPSLEPLYQAVYARPDADAPRHVLADALLERGDPRGEFIELQLSRASRATPATAREQRLLKRWERDWTAPLGPELAQDAIFERGFVVSAALVPVAGHTPDSAWATVSALRVYFEPDDAQPDLLASPAFANARELTSVPTRWIDACLARGSLQWRVVRAHGDLRALEALTKRVRSTRGLPALQDFTWLADDGVPLVRAVRLLTSEPWAHVAALTLDTELGTLDLRKAEWRLRLLSPTAGQLEAVASTLRALPAGAVTTLVLDCGERLGPHGIRGRSGVLSIEAIRKAVRRRPMKILNVAAVGGTLLDDVTALVLGGPARTVGVAERLAAARSRINANDFAAALEELKAVLEADPERSLVRPLTDLMRWSHLQLADNGAALEPHQLQSGRAISVAISNWLEPH